MRFGFVVPYATAREFAELAALGERHGWDAVFTWEALWGEAAWVTLGAAAMTTERIRLGTLLTPASRWRPWDLASAVGTVDRLSGGRAVLSAGLGAVHEGWTAFEPDEGRRVRARKLDECLAIYDGLMRGQPFSYDGAYYQARPTDFLLPEPPVQRPRPPVWVVGTRVPGRAAQPSLARAARWDGLLPVLGDADDGTAPDGSTSDGCASDSTASDSTAPNSPERLAALVAAVRALREAAGLAADPYDVVLEADSSGEFTRLDPPDPASWAAAGATWWVESWWTVERGPAGLAEVRRRIGAGPPR